MTELPIIVNTNEVTVGGVVDQVELQLSVGAQGERGSRIFSGNVSPLTLPVDSPYFAGYTEFIPGDMYIERSISVLALWEWKSQPDGYTWVETATISTGEGGGGFLDADLEAIAALTGTNGLLRKTATNTWVLDTNPYLTSNQLITLSGDVSGTGTTSISTTVADDSHSHTSSTISALDAGDTTTGTFNIARIPTGSTGTTVSLGNHTHSYQPVDADLTAIAALAGTSGLLKKTAADTWTLDTNTYLTANQSITLSGDATGSGTTAITVVVVDDSHSHTGATISALDAGDVTTGTFNIARIPTGTTGTTVALGNHTHSYQPLDSDLTSIAALSGTSGFLKTNGAGTWSVDTASYLTANQTITLSGDASGSGTTSITVTVADDSHAHTGATISGLDAGDTTTGTFNITRIPTGTTGTTVALGNHTHSEYQAADGDLTAISALTGTGYLKRTGADTWTLDTPATATWGSITGTLSNQTDLNNALNAKQAADNDLTAIAALAGTSGFLKKTATDTWTLDASTYLTANQTITLSGDASGSGTTAITVTVADDSHAHTGATISGLDAGDTTTGTFNIARIPTGTTGTTVALGNHTHSYQPVDADLTAIAALTGTGFLKRTGTDTWALAAAGTGDVVGPASATDNAVVVYDGTTGKLIQNSTLTYNYGSLTVTSGAMYLGSAGDIGIYPASGYPLLLNAKTEIWTDGASDDFITGIYGESTKWLIDQYGTYTQEVQGQPAIKSYIGLGAYGSIEWYNGNPYGVKAGYRGNVVVNTQDGSMWINIGGIPT